MSFVASSPNKIHLAGEHSVVYGGWALMAPVEVNGKRNRVTLDVSDSPAGQETFSFKGDLGSATMRADGSMAGDALYYAVFEAVKTVFSRNEFKLAGSSKRFDAVLEFGGAPKGTGNSASLPAALAAALYAHFGVKPSKTDLFDAAYATDNVYHGGKSSGGDPRAVVSDKPLEFRKVFASSGVSFEYMEADLSLPKGAALLLVDSFKSGEKSTTAGLIAEFAKKSGAKKPPGELSHDVREKITAPFDEIVEKIVAECKPSGSAEKLGKLFDENHVLLAESGVSSEGIEAVLKVAKNEGAFGGKLIGAGGNAGAVIVLVPQDKSPKIAFGLASAGFKSYEVSFAKRGAGIDA